MHKKITKKLIAIAEQTVIAIFLCSIVLLVLHFTVEKYIGSVISIINVTAFEKTDGEVKRDNTELNTETNMLKNYPHWGDLWGTLSIPSIDRTNLPIYQGDDLSIIKNGPGHHSGSYFPGQGGSIIIAAHNSVRDFYYLPQVKIGDTITIRTDYGTYDYQVYKTDIINEKEGNKVPVHNEYEEVILYTCYPVGGVGYKSQRFVAYAKLALVER